MPPDKQDGQLEPDDEIVKNESNSQIDPVIPVNMPMRAAASFHDMMGFMMEATSGPRDPLIEKFTPEHVTIYLGNLENEAVRTHELRKNDRWIYSIGALVILGFIIWLIIYLSTNNIGLLTDLIQIALGLIGGFGSGYAYKTYRDQRN